MANALVLGLEVEAKEEAALNRPTAAFVSAETRGLPHAVSRSSSRLGRIYHSLG